MKKWMKYVTAITLGAFLIGCANNTSQNNKTTEKAAEKQSITLDGSTSMNKVIGGLSEAFEAETKIKVSYNATGSGAGIQAVQEGRADIGLSSRKLKDEEKNKGLQDHILALDGIALVVNPKNNVSNLSVEDIAKIFKGEITNWNQLGGADGEIVVIGREAGSGTRDGFESITKTKDKSKYRQELTSTGDVISTVASNPNAIGYASVASVKNTVKAVTVNGVAPSEATIKDGTYVVQRPFILVTVKDKALSKSAKQLLDFMLSKNAHSIITKSGVVPAN